MLAIGFSSCRTQKANITVDQTNYQLAGLWYFSKVDTTMVNPPYGEEWPHISFNTTDNRISGNVGCNSVMGNFTYNDKGQLSFQNMGTTMMMCPSMELEQKIVLAMSQVSGYSINEVTQEMFLSNSAGDTVMVLSKIDPRTLLQYKQKF